MRLTVPRPAAPTAPSGFTLIEIMVVLAIVGIILGVASVKFMPNDAEALSQAATRTAQILELAHDRAMDDYRTIGMTVDGGALRFWRLDAQRQWQPLPETDMAAPDKGARIEDVRVNEQPLPDGERLEFSPGGTQSPYTLRLSIGARSVVLRGDALGHVKVDAP